MKIKDNPIEGKCYDIHVKQPIENFPDKLGEVVQQCQAVLAIIGEKYE